MAIRTPKPIISFTFDDFPETALSVGGVILQRHGLLGTYYVSLELAGRQDASGQMFTFSDLRALQQQGHEMGCHTFGHCDSSYCPTSDFVESVRSNQQALDRLLPGAHFRTFSFPKSAPRARTKNLIGQRFECCRGGGQTFNAGIADLNYLRAYFLEQAKGNVSAVRQIIDQNREAKGWLILATHDVCPQPSRFGCTPDFFAAVVNYAVQSGARTLPVIRAFEELRDASGSSS